MNAFSSNLDRLRVATPCPISWEQMAGNDRVRFCGHCQLNVYNISELSKTEAESLIASTEGRLCARIYRRADGTVLTKDCPVGLRALRKRISKRVAAVFAAIVSVSSAASSQEKATGDNAASCPSQTKITRSKAPDGSTGVVSGTVYDPLGAVIPAATVTLINETTNEKTTTLANEAGHFAFASVTPGMYEVSMESPGFASQRVIHLEVAVNQLVNVDTYVSLPDQPLTGVVSVIDPDAELQKQKPATTTITEKMIKRLPLN